MPTHTNIHKDADRQNSMCTWFVKIGTTVDVKSLSSNATPWPLRAFTFAKTVSIINCDRSFEKPNCDVVYCASMYYAYVYTCMYTYELTWPDPPRN